ncbi:hypothetical protein BKA62DRAFT_314628 [Auriculariales sp. MPI-PUGE-AT-0066]|nr:hypothetical protein BKA62DRAFT_314628 [Auriculariales sp. MPI-PUGE-AT-0066]
MTIQPPSTVALPTVSGSRAPLPDSRSSSKLTDQGDKLTALPTHNSRPALHRHRSGSLPSSRFDIVGPSGSPGRTSRESNSEGESTPHRHERVSFDMDIDSPPQGSPAGLAKWKNTLNRLTGHTSSDPVLPNSREAGTTTPPPPQTRGRTESRTGTASIGRMLATTAESWRAASRTRLQQTGTTARQPFIPLNPFEARPTILRVSDSEIRRRRERWRHIAAHAVRLVYLHFLLRLPSLYFSRVCRVFEDANVSQPDIERLQAVAILHDHDLEAQGATATASHASLPRFPSSPREWSELIERREVSNELVRFKGSWEDFVDGLMREWKTLNVVSALLLSAIVSIFQIDAAANDQTTRTAAFLSLCAALFALIYGCTFILRFGTMRRMEKAAQWAHDAQRTQTDIFWNVWVLLATPAIWLAWSVIFFIVTILAFLWTSGTTNPPHTPSWDQALGPRVFVTCVFVLGLVYFLLVITTFRSYGLSRRNMRSHLHHHHGLPAYAPHSPPRGGGLALSPQQTRESQTGLSGSPPLPRAETGSPDWKKEQHAFGFTTD